jgi:uncharacterized protein (DUF2141 family)
MVRGTPVLGGVHGVAGKSCHCGAHFYIDTDIDTELRADATCGRLSVTVTGLRNNDGVVRCALFNSPAAFPKAGQEWRGVITPIRDRQATCVFSGVPAGNYAVAFFHAEHNETQLTPGLFGKPTQGFGFSNNASGSFGPPSFSAAAFAYNGANLTLQGSLTY